MAGDTEVLEYDDYKIQPEFEWKLDLDVQDLILKQRRKHNNKSANADSTKRIYTDAEDDTISTTIKLAQKSQSCFNKHKSRIIIQETPPSTSQCRTHVRPHSGDSCAKLRSMSPLYRCRQEVDESKKQRRKN